jgi:signal transduction histidine kinase
MRQDGISETWLLTAPATRRQMQIAAVVGIALLTGLALCVPFAELQLARVDAFIPTFEGAVILTDLITSVLLFSQSSMFRSRALLALASGYLFSSLMAASHVLTFPGAFAPTGLLGAGPQTAGWLYVFWHWGLVIAVTVYAGLSHERPADEAPANRSWPRALGLSLTGVVALAVALTLLATTGGHLLPSVFLDSVNTAPLGRYAVMLNAMLGGLALLVLWRKRPRSALDMWIMLMILALLAELVTNSILISARFTFGWYLSRLFAVGTSTIVLAALLQETISLYGRMARSHEMLLRERSNMLLNLEALAGAIRHEVAQPLAAAQMEAEALKLLVRQVPPDPDEASLAAEQIIANTRRATDVIENIRNLFGRKQRPAPVNLNEIVLEAVENLREELKLQGVVTRVELLPSLPEVKGHRGQLHQVLLNLLQNAIDAMRIVDAADRELTVKTRCSGDLISVSVADTGPGLDAKVRGQVFEPFFTTKTNGMGLGLAICRMIVDQHGGRIAALPGRPRGEIFEIELPAIEPVKQPAPSIEPLRTQRWFGRLGKATP